MPTVKRRKKSPEERGYQPIEEVAAGLRALAAQLAQDNEGRLAKVSLNIWYEDPEPDITAKDDNYQEQTGAVVGGVTDGLAGLRQ